VSAVSYPTPYTQGLKQNHPNPFNPATLISYEMNRPGLATISIYDITGSLVKTLLSEYHEPGRFEIVWHGANERGRQVSSGIYFYRLTVGDFVETKRMTLTR
jgi:flagellar hook assembly protein FlgD